MSPFLLNFTFAFFSFWIHDFGECSECSESENRLNNIKVSVGNCTVLERESEFNPAL